MRELDPHYSAYNTMIAYTARIAARAPTFGMRVAVLSEKDLRSMPSEADVVAWLESRGGRIRIWLGEEARAVAGGSVAGQHLPQLTLCAVGDKPFVMAKEKLGSIVARSATVEEAVECIKDIARFL